MVPVAVGNVDLAVERIDGDVSRLIEHRPAGVETRRFAARAVARRAVADLKQQAASVVRPLLDHTAATAANPEIVFVIDKAAVNSQWQNVWITPSSYDIPVAVVLDDWRRRDLADLCF
jgi:hypothetical protein